ncbi:MAG: NAD+ synthase [Halanaerobiales bacterium]
MADLNYNKVEKKLIEWLRKKVDKAGAKGAVVGLSGGIDSSVTAVLCQKAFADNELGIIMPCYSDKEAENDARLLAESFNIDYMVKDLSSVFDKMAEILLGEKTFDSARDMAAANIKPRLRMTTLYYFAAKYNYLVIGTDNWSELKIGYFTKFGDGGVDLAPLGRLVKTEVRELAENMGIPQKIINKKPSAGLWQGQTDEDELGFNYEQLDKYILKGEADGEIKEKIEKLANNNAHKLEPIPHPSRQELI